MTQAFADQDAEQDQPDWVQSVIQKTILKMIREHEKASKSIMLSKLLKETKAGPLASNHPVFIKDDDRKEVKESWDGFDPDYWKLTGPSTRRPFTYISPHAGTIHSFVGPITENLNCIRSIGTL